MKKREAVSSLAIRYYHRLAQRAGGALPPVTSERAWQGLAETMRISAGPLPRPCPKTFNARLFFHRGLGQWFIAYTPDAHARLRCEMICHELVEYMTHQDFGPVIDRAPRYTFAYDGGARPGDIRHLISLAVTHMAFGASGLAAFGAPGPAVRPSFGDAELASEAPDPCQLRLAIDVPAPSRGADGPPREAPAPAARWPHRSGLCRCGCQGMLRDLLEET